MDNKDLPIGLTMSLAQNSEAMGFFGTLSDAEKSQVVNYIESTNTGETAKARIQKAVESLANHDGSIFGK